MCEWKSVRQFKSSDTNVSKFVFEKDDIAVEAVLYRYGSYAKRTVICCSTQCGCPVGCTFCGTGRFFVRNLTNTDYLNGRLSTKQFNNVDVPEPKEDEEIGNGKFRY